MRRNLSWIAVPVLVVGLAACSSGDSGGDSTTETTTASSQTTTTKESTTEVTTSASSTASTSSSGSSSPKTSESSTTTSGTSSASSTGGGGAGGGPTTISKVWVDDGWTVEKVSEDICALGGLTTSNYSQQDELFTCGATAANAMACTFADGGKTTCITNPLTKMAIRFTSPTVDNWDGEMHPREGGPIPMYVELKDGTQCSVAAHDQSQHWNGKFSWYPCSDGSELLTDESIVNTFDDSKKAWTVQRSVDQGKPTTTWVKTAVFAGTR